MRLSIAIMIACVLGSASALGPRFRDRIPPAPAPVPTTAAPTTLAPAPTTTAEAPPATTLAPATTAP